MEVNGEAFQLHTVYKNIFFTKSHVSVLQVMREFVSGTTSHVRASECAKKSCDKIIITIVPSCTGKVSLFCCRWHCYSCCTLVDNTDGNKLGIISGIALYCGDTYISLAFVFAKLDYGKSKNKNCKVASHIQVIRLG